MVFLRRGFLGNFSDLLRVWSSSTTQNKPLSRHKFHLKMDFRPCAWAYSEYVWIFEIILQHWRSKSDFSHSSHTNGFSPVWFIINWLVSGQSLCWANIISHSTQLATRHHRLFSYYAFEEYTWISKPFHMWYRWYVLGVFNHSSSVFH